MEHFELVEKLRERSGLTYEEAKQALEENDWDLLAAMVRLESEGRVKGDKAQAATQANDAREGARDAGNTAREARAKAAGKADHVLQSIGAFISRVAELGMRNTLELRREDKVVMSLPLLVVVLLLIVAFWLMVPAAIVAVCFGFRFKLRGKDIERVTKQDSQEG